jgi:glycosyltransferase involved in cell wall biosynthesis
MRLYVVGDGSERGAGEAQAVDAGLADVVNFVGWRSDTMDWHGAADIVALSSDNEGTPVTLIEAAAAGRPVVSTAVGGVPDVVTNGVTGILVDVNDEPGLAGALIRLGEDRALAARMGQAAPERAERFGIARLVDDLEAIYREILDLPR